jgi:hypothetical protein
MSLINNISEPKDMLLKLIREGNRINFEDDYENISDHFFNFSVTAHSLRDWCIKYQGLQSNKKVLHTQWDKEPFLAVAKDIANSVKHFGIDYYKPQIQDSEYESTDIIQFCEGENISEKFDNVLSDESFREASSEKRPSYIVKFKDGPDITLNEYVFKTVTFWNEYFIKESIPIDPSRDIRHLFINRSFWNQFT